MPQEAKLARSGGEQRWTRSSWCELSAHRSTLLIVASLFLLFEAPISLCSREPREPYRHLVAKGLSGKDALHSQHPRAGGRGSADGRLSDSNDP
jgi:hypothetical protein